MKERKDIEECKEGDLVAVFGGALDHDSRTADSVSFCKVLIVGQEDLVVESNIYYSTSFYVVPKSICRKIYLNPEVLASAKTIEPNIGDLVVHFSRTAGEHDRKSGILCKIIYRMGQPDRCEILSGTETINVPWNNIVVLEKKVS